jgi:predicted tellurium resistance membrane protein TerC
VFVLGFIGIKMLLHHRVEISNLLSLGVILCLLGIGVLSSVWSNKRDKSAHNPQQR